MSNYEPFMAVTDTHGKELDPDAWAAAMRFKEVFKPKHRIHLGDLWDFANIRVGASQGDEAENVEEDMDAGEAIINQFQPTVLLLGNHDCRLWRLLSHPNGVLADWAKLRVARITNHLQKIGCRKLPYDARKGIYRLGSLKLLHGYHAGANACRMHAGVYGNSIFGHVHSIEMQSIPGLDERESRSIGCLCKLDLEYMGCKTGKLRWRHGFAYGFVNTKTGKYDLVQARSIDGNWFLPDRFLRI